MEELEIIGREKELFSEDLLDWNSDICKVVESSRFLILGGAGSIGQAVTKEIFARNPLVCHVIDISENNLVELVRDLRSSLGYIAGDFATFCIDIGSREFEVFCKSRAYDYVLNLSALKHVRSEKDEFSLRRMLEVNVANTLKSIRLSESMGVKKYFCVSTDKAANPVNLMGASKRLMELIIRANNFTIPVSMARFANVAFSDGSLLHSFRMRLNKRQPIVAPTDTGRYFVTSKESGLLCLFSSIYGNDGEVFYPRTLMEKGLVYFDEVATRFLRSKGYEPNVCESEESARKQLPTNSTWPCYFSKSDTDGEKLFEEFYTENELRNEVRFKELGVVISGTVEEVLKDDLLAFEEVINSEKFSTYSKSDILNKLSSLIEGFTPIINNKSLEGKM
ncbi:polysaccharide biosynthesis protein [Schleiferiaceae bacterium]|nr:polysaccharide biosynthesis protein [Schleiferiaceae bacterium]